MDEETPVEVEQNCEEPEAAESESEIEQVLEPPAELAEDTETDNEQPDDTDKPDDSEQPDPEPDSNEQDNNEQDENDKEEPVVENQEVAEDNPDNTESDEPKQNKGYRIPKLSESSDKTFDNEDAVNVSVDQSHENEELLIEDEAKDPPRASSSEDERPRHKRERHHRRRRSRTRSRSRSRERYPVGRETDREIRSRVFVGHLNTDEVTKKEIERLFSPYGRVVKVLLNAGYGFVQYDNEDSARAAINEVHGTPLAGMKIVVDKTVKHKRLIGEDPKSERPLPRAPPPSKSYRERLDYEEMDYLRERERRFARLEEMERRYFMDRLPPPLPPRPRDSYFDRYGYMDRAPPAHYMDYDRGRYADYERRDRFLDEPYSRRSYDDYRYR